MVDSPRNLTIRGEGGFVDIVPDGWVDPINETRAQTIAVRGGTVTHRPDAAAGAAPHTLLFNPPAATWLADVYGSAAAAAASDAWAALETSGEEPPSRRALAAPEDPRTGDALRRLCRALWHRRWWPAADATDPDRPFLDEELLDVDLGTLAWECQAVLPDTSWAEITLGRARARLLAALGAAQEVSGGVREYVDERLRTAVDATLDVADDEDTSAALDALEAFRDREDATDAAIADARAAWDATVEEGESERLAYAAEAAPPPAEGIIRTTTVDWAMVPARTVGSSENNVVWAAFAAPGGLRLDVSVEVGDRAATAPLVAWVHAEPTGLLVAKVALEVSGKRYRGRAISPLLPPDRVDHLSLHVVESTIPPSAHGRTVPWRSADRLAHAAEDRRFIRRVVAACRARRDDPTSAPLLVELGML